MTHSTPSSRAETIQVVCLVAIDADKHILATQRAADKPLALLWEFPGGKIEPGESAPSALRREIREELDIELGELLPQAPVVHDYDFGRIELTPFIARVARRPEGLTLHAHRAAQWIALADWQRLQWADADVPIIQRLLQTELGR